MKHNFTLGSKYNWQHDKDIKKSNHAYLKFARKKRDTETRWFKWNCETCK